MKIKAKNGDLNNLIIEQKAWLAVHITMQIFTKVVCSSFCM